jgi:hypothetical protein
MKGPHGLNAIRLYPQFPEGYLKPPFEVEWTPPRTAEGLTQRTVFVFGNVNADSDVVGGNSTETLARAVLLHVEGDNETRDAALAWLLDLCNIRYGGGV